MAIEIVDFPIKNGDFPLQNVSSPEGNHENETTNLEYGWHYVGKTAWERNDTIFDGRFNRQEHESVGIYS